MSTSANIRNSIPDDPSTFSLPTADGGWVQQNRFLDTAGQLHIWAHIWTHAWAHTGNFKPQKTLTWKGRWSLSPTPCWGAISNWWPLEGVHFSSQTANTGGSTHPEGSNPIHTPIALSGLSGLKNTKHTKLGRDSGGGIGDEKENRRGNREWIWSKYICMHEILKQ